MTAAIKSLGLLTLEDVRTDGRSWWFPKKGETSENRNHQPGGESRRTLFFFLKAVISSQKGVKGNTVFPVVPTHDDCKSLEADIS